MYVIDVYPLHSLQEGIEKYGEGNWQKILDDPDFGARVSCIVSFCIIIPTHIGRSFRTEAA